MLLGKFLLLYAKLLKKWIVDPVYTVTILGYYLMVLTIKI